MPKFTEEDTLASILEQKPKAIDLFDPAHRDQLPRFKSYPLRFAAQYIGLPRAKLQKFIEELNKLP